MLVAHLVGYAIPSPWRSRLYEPTIDPVDGNLDVPNARAPIERPISQSTAASVRPTLLSAAFADLDRRGIGWRWRRAAPQGAHAHPRTEPPAARRFGRRRRRGTHPDRYSASSAHEQHVRRPVSATEREQ